MCALMNAETSGICDETRKVLQRGAGDSNAKLLLFFSGDLKMQLGLFQFACQLAG